MQARLRGPAYVDEEEEEISPISRAVSLIASPFRAAVSKQAQRAYLGSLLFASASIILLGIATVAYWIFYFKFVPQIGLERDVHLQFGNGHPWGTAILDSELASLQPYDVSVMLDLPRTPSNLAAGNFMLDLSLHSRPSKSIMTAANTSTQVLSHSRRPAILTYASSVVDTAHKVSRLPFYVFGWRREAEILEVNMMEQVEFAKGWRNLPGSLRLEIQSTERMQVYGAKVKFLAKYTGLRWFMYRWKLTSFLVFTGMFWGVSMTSSAIAWLTLSSLFGSGAKEPEKSVKKEERDDRPIKAEEEESDSDSHEASFKREVEHIKQEEDSDDQALVDPHAAEADDEDDEGQRIRESSGPGTDSGIGTSLESASAQGVQRRRSRLFGGH
ncbi:CCR4-NOT core subunit cdc39 [Paecilomyces lecythidis]